MRVAILSDIHGNSVAFDVVLADVERQGGVDEYWLLGDLVAMGPDPVGVMQRIQSLPTSHAIRGNTDRWLLDVHTELPFLRQETLADDQTKLPYLLELAYSMIWTQGALMASGDLDWVANLPLEYRRILSNNTRVLCVHAAPGEDDGDGIRPTMSDEQLATMIAETEADLILVGHTHWALDRTIAGVRLVNLGSVSLPVLPDLRASYVLLEANAEGYRIIPRQVDYDHQRVIEQLQAQKHPGSASISAFLAGKRKPFWEG